MRRISLAHLALALGMVFGASWLAYGALGGADGVRLSYQGRIELNGVAVDYPVNLTFQVYNAASGGSACWSGAVNDVTPRDGAFSVTFGPVTEGCVKDQDVWLGLLVDGTPMAGRQKITPVLAAVTSGRGDHFVATQLQAASASVTGLVSAGSLQAAGGTFSGAVTVNGAGKILDVNGAAEIDVLNVTQELNVDGDLDVSGTVTWQCPAGTGRVGSWCMSDSQGPPGNLENALLVCHNQGMDLCPLSAILACDRMNLPAGGNQCGAVTDRAHATAGGNVIMTGSSQATDWFVSSFTRPLCFSQETRYVSNGITLATGQNVHFPCPVNSVPATHFYCCAPVSAP